jgi:predicted alpha/beta superfamily hydrolase
MTDGTKRATAHSLKRTLRVCYPAGKGKLVLRTELDWQRDVQPIAASEDGNITTFDIEARQPFVYFKPCLIQGDKFHWATGTNDLLVMGADDARIVYPYFFSDDRGNFSPLIEIPSDILGRDHRLRVYLPPGYEENTLARYPIAYMQDGQNLFFPEEAFQGRDWQVDETSHTLRAMRAVEDLIIVGVYSAGERRMEEYTQPGYKAYARSLVEEIVPAEQRYLRVSKDRCDRSMLGSSLGGVVSFFTAWEYPEVFGAAACMSSTFSFKDDLIERVLSEPKREVRFYLDSGWPNDNYEVTIAMATALVSRGWQYGRDLIHLCFPQAAHDEKAWGVRLHLPVQLFNGVVARVSRAMSTNNRR